MRARERMTSLGNEANERRATITTTGQESIGKEKACLHNPLVERLHAVSASRCSGSGFPKRATPREKRGTLVSLALRASLRGFVIARPLSTMARTHRRKTRRYKSRNGSSDSYAQRRSGNVNKLNVLRAWEHSDRVVIARLASMGVSYGRAGRPSACR